MDATMFWVVRKPLLWIWRKLVGLLGAWTVEPILRQSHDHHVALRRWQRRWVELAEGLDYKLLTRSSFEESGNAEQSIWIRNSSQTNIEEIHFCVDAKLGSASYQVPLAAYRLQPGCMARLALPGLPLQDLAVHEDGVFVTYDSVQVYPVRIVRGDKLEIYSTGGIAWHPTHDDYLNGEWKRWNGRLYSLKALADARHEYAMKLAHALCWQHGLFGMDAASLMAQALQARRYGRLPGVAAFAVLSRGSVLKLMHWTRLLLRVERIRFECDPAMAAATEHILKRGKSARPTRVLHLDPSGPTHANLA